MFNSMILILTNDPNPFWVKAVVAFLVMIALYFLFGCGLRRFRFNKRDLKAAGLNHQQQREWLATHKRKNKSKKRKIHF